MDSTQKRARIFFLVFIILILFTGVIPLASYVKDGKLSKAWNDFSKNFQVEDDQSVQIAPTPKPTNATTPKPTSVGSSVGTKQPTTKATPSQPKECYRFKVTHLDGSTSNLCYTKGDYDQLVDWGYKYSSAKSFYEFHLEGAQNYQDQYDRTGSSIYLDAKASSEQSAQREKDKMTQAIAAMQEIEKRGY